MSGQGIGEAFGVDTGVATQGAAVSAVRQKQRDRAVALGLDAEGAAEFEGGGKSGGERQGLAEQLAVPGRGCPVA